VKLKDNKQWRFFADRNIISQTIDVYWMAQGLDGKSYRREFGEYQSLASEDEGITHKADPTFRMDYEEAQTLVQELWNAGLRPEGVEGTVEHVNALKAHIKAQSDMLQHFMAMQKADSEPLDADVLNFHEEITKIKAVLQDLNPGLAEF